MKKQNAEFIGSCIGWGLFGAYVDSSLLCQNVGLNQSYPRADAKNVIQLIDY